MEFRTSVQESTGEERRGKQIQKKERETEKKAGVFGMMIREGAKRLIAAIILQAIDDLKPDPDEGNEKKLAQVRANRRSAIMFLRSRWGAELMAGCGIERMPEELREKIEKSIDF